MRLLVLLITGVGIRCVRVRYLVWGGAIGTLWRWRLRLVLRVKLGVLLLCVARLMRELLKWWRLRMVALARR